MSNSQEDCVLNSTFDINYYVEGANDAATRTRTVTIVLVVACVLISIGWYNSMRWSWARDRVRSAYNIKDETILKVLYPENPATVVQPEVLDSYRTNLQAATVTAYVENIRFLRVPFFGIAFDVNDLGLIGGFGLVTVLVLMRYSLSREIKNLNVSFRESEHHKQLCAFYHALAMRQLFTVPHMKGEKQNRKLAKLPEIVCIMPALLFTLGVLYDYYSVFVLDTYGPRRVLFTLCIEAVWWILICALSFKCWERKRHINGIWDKYWKRIEGKKSSVVLLHEDMVNEFGSDDDVNEALRALKSLRAQVTRGQDAV
ncbi:MAG TPA: hypothetical protein VF656_15545 [Pyrinomonadaceae bacterium]|jgi:hypothetical protein